MRFFLDHDVPVDIAHVLRHEAHEVTELRSVLTPTTQDRDVLAHANKHGLILVTCNRDDFLTLARSEPHSGLIILIRRRTRIAECAALLQLIARAGDAGLERNINFA